MRQYKALISAEELQIKYNSGERDFTFHDFDSINFENLILTDANFESSWFHSATFTNCNLMNVNFDNSCMKCIEFKNVNLNGTSFRNSTICGTTFENCDLRNSNFTDAESYGGIVTTEKLLELEQERNRTK